MKVCTDACLFGAWVAEKLNSQQMTADCILDIGAGTGLLSLMLAQVTSAHIDALEINAEATQQCAGNFRQSPWSERLQVFQQDIKGWGKAGYSLIISNPPFFENDLKSPDTGRNQALHDASLTLEQLWQQVGKMLHPKGHFALLLPVHRLNEALLFAKQYGFAATETIQVCQTEKHAPFRVMAWFQKENPSPNKELRIVIKENGRYSERFTELLRDYYLAL